MDDEIPRCSGISPATGLVYLMFGHMMPYGFSLMSTPTNRCAMAAMVCLIELRVGPPKCKECLSPMRVTVFGVDWIDIHIVYIV